MIDFIEDAIKHLDRDDKYMKVHKNTALSKYGVVGIRMKLIRDVAKELTNTVCIKDIIGLQPTTIEELNMIGFLIGFHPCKIEEKFDAIDYFISINDNWVTNDAVSSSFKDNSDIYFNYLMKKVFGNEWEARFAIISLMYNFLDKEHLHAILDGLYNIEYGRKYVDMAVAWLLSYLYMDFRDEVEEFYENAPLNKFILRLVVTKVRDILEMPQEYKERIEDIYKDVLCKKGL